MRKTERFIVLVLLVLFVAGCSRSEKKPGQLSSKKLDSLRSQFESLNSEMALNWSVMIEDDNEKFFSMKRLLEEVSYTGAYNEKQFNQLMQELEEVRESRYTQETMKDSDLIDRYDSMSSRIISEVIDFAQHHPEYESYPLMNELVNEIMESQYNVLHHRIRYDKSVDDYNGFISENEQVMDQISDRNIHHMPVFRIEE